MLYQEKNGVEKLKEFLSEWKESAKRLKAAERVEQGREQERDPLTPGAITTITADETGPAPTPEQTKELLERDRPASGAVVLPEKLEDEAGAPKVQWERVRATEQERTETETVGDDGKVAHFPTMPSPTPARETNLEHLRNLEHYETAMVILNIAEAQCELCPREREERCNEDCNNGLCEWLGQEYDPESPAWRKC